MISLFSALQFIFLAIRFIFITCRRTMGECICEGSSKIKLVNVLNIINYLSIELMVQLFILIVLVLGI